MPLGKLSKKQIESAYKVLSEALKLISEKQDTKDDSSSSPSSSSSSTSSQARIKAQLLDCSNRFFTLIPHDFGMKKPPILDDLELIKVRAAFWLTGKYILDDVIFFYNDDNNSCNNETEGHCHHY